MSIPKTIGIETEYGISHRGVDNALPSADSALLINAYLRDAKYLSNDQAYQVNWDFIDETPGNDVRGFSVGDAQTQNAETHLVNAVLRNGARFYVDHAHPEISTPECADALSLVLYDRAAELIGQRAMKSAQEFLQDDQELVLYKNNSDGKGNSYGCHENYLVDRATPFGEIVNHCISHFVTRQIYCGSGKVGVEPLWQASDGSHFQLSQRADFIEEEVGLETTLKRPIINTRDEPHADARKYRRLHVIVGDANMSQVATFLKVGTTALVLALIEDGALSRDFVFAAPVAAIRSVSNDLTLTKPLELVDGSTITALEVQWELYDQSRKYVETYGTEAVGGEVALAVLDRWESVLSALETDPLTLGKQIDWVAKYLLIERYRSRHSLAWQDIRLRVLDIQYHDMRPHKSLAVRLGLEQIIDGKEAEEAINNPPDNTRAYFRGNCIKHFASSVVAANWDSVVFDLGNDTLRRVPMREPMRATAAVLGKIFEESENATDLVRRLSS